MLKKLLVLIPLLVLSLISFIFPYQKDISASDKYTVIIDYNLDEIKYYLPAHICNSINNEIKTVNRGEIIEIPALTQTLNCYYKCVFTENGNIYDFNTPVTKDMCIVANWTPIEYTIHYNYLENEENEIKNIEYTRKYTIEDGKINYYRPERDYFIFIDWYTSSSLNDQFLAIYKTEYSIGDIYLYAKWRPVDFKINYNTDAKNIYNLPTYNVNSLAFDLNAPEKEGHIFEGWYLDKEFTRKCTRIDSSFKGDLNLYPKWKKEVYTVTYILPNGTKATINVEYGDTVKLPETNNNIFEVIKTDVSRKNITGDTTINISYVNIWYIYLIGLLLIVSVTILITLAIIKKKRNISKLRYVYSVTNNKTRRWK